MKKLLTLILASTLICTLGACGKKNKPVDVELPTTPVVDTIETIDEMLAVSTEAKNYETSMLAHDAIIRGLGFKEFYPVAWQVANVYEDYIPEHLVYVDKTFKLEFQHVVYDGDTAESSLVDGWTLYGTKGTAPNNITSYKASDYMFADEYDPYAEVENYQNDYCIRKTYSFYNIENDVPTKLIVCEAYYYPETGNLYNLVREMDPMGWNYRWPQVLIDTKENANAVIPNEFAVEWIDDYPVEVAKFTIKSGSTEETFKYRVGMTLSTWAVSELNTSDWLVAFDEALFSEDYKYVIEEGYLDIRDLMSENGIIEATKNNLYSKKELEEAFTFSYTPTTQMHLVNWKTPLLLNGIRIESNYTGYYTYQNFNIGHLYHVDDILKIYFSNIHEELLPDIKIYAFTEPVGIANAIEQGGGLHGHNKADPTLYDFMQIPENAYEISLEKLPNHDHNHDSDVPCTNDDAVGVYITTQDPNFTPYNTKALAITYKNTLVYWVHMPFFSDNVQPHDDLAEDNVMTEEELQKFLEDMEKQGFLLEEITSE